MRISEFRALAHDEFGRPLAETLIADLVLAALDTTAAGALAAGEDPRTVWLALCEAMDVPAERRLGRDRSRRVTRSGRSGAADGQP